MVAKSGSAQDYYDQYYNNNNQQYRQYEYTTPETEIYNRRTVPPSVPAPQYNYEQPTAAPANPQYQYPTPETEGYYSTPPKIEPKKEREPEAYPYYYY